MKYLPLSPEETQEALKFIKKKGFKEDLQLRYISEHFFYQLSLLKSQQPNASFQSLLTSAHESLGFSGFRSLSDQMERELREVFRSTFKSEWRKSINNIGLWLAVICTIFLLFFFQNEVLHCFQTLNHWTSFIVGLLLSLIPHFILVSILGFFQLRNQYIRIAYGITPQYFFMLPMWWLIIAGIPVTLPALIIYVVLLLAALILLPPTIITLKYAHNKYRQHLEELPILEEATI